MSHGKVKLKKKSGATVTISLSKLSPADRQWIDAHVATEPKAAQPEKTKPASKTSEPAKATPNPKEGYDVKLAQKEGVSVESHEPEALARKWPVLALLALRVSVALQLATQL